MRREWLVAPAEAGGRNLAVEKTVIQVVENLSPDHDGFRARATAVWNRVRGARRQFGGEWPAGKCRRDSTPGPRATAAAGKFAPEGFPPGLEHQRRSLSQHVGNAGLTTPLRTVMVLRNPAKGWNRASILTNGDLIRRRPQTRRKTSERSAGGRSGRSNCSMQKLYEAQ